MAAANNLLRVIPNSGDGPNMYSHVIPLITDTNTLYLTECHSICESLSITGASRYRGEKKVTVGAKME